MSKIISGNLNIDAKNNPDKRGWFIGYFMDEGSPFKNNDFEVKWGVHPKGIIKPIAGTNMVAKSMTILIDGKVVIELPKNKKEILSKLGDYVFLDNGISHSSQALIDSITLTIRYPSIPDDQKIIK